MAVAMWTKVAGLVALTSTVVLGRIDQTLAQFQRADYPAGGVGDLATPASLPRPEPAIAVAEGWSASAAPWDLDSIGSLTMAYLVTDLALMIALAGLLFVWLAKVPLLQGRPMTIIIGGYVVADACETALACLAWRNYASIAGLVGALSWAKWVLLLGAVVTLAVFSVRRYFEKTPLLRSRRLGVLLDAVLRFRAQVVVVGFLAAVFLLLSSDLGRQVDDVLVRAAEQTVPALVASGLAIAASAAVAWTCARCALAYKDAPATVQPGWSQRRVGFWTCLSLLAGFLAASFVSEDVRAFCVSGAIVAGSGVLVFVPTLRPAASRYLRRGAGVTTAAPTSGFLKPVLVAGPLIVLYLAIVRALATELGGPFSPNLWGWLVASLLCLLLIPRLNDIKATEAPGVWDSTVQLGLATAAYVGLALFVPVTGWMTLGTPAVLFLWASIATLMLSGLVVLADSLELRGVIALGLFSRWPALGYLLVWSLVASAVDLRGAYYDVRLRELPGSSAGTAAFATAPDSFTTWMGSAPASGATSLVFVASAGGGIRAAYWTAISWACVFEAECGDSTVDAAPIPSEKVFLASGVSGGSLGLVSIRSHELDSTDSKWMDSALVADFVAPALAAYLFRDLPNSALRLPWLADRAGQLELAWESADIGLDTSFTQGTANRFPRLILNSTSVEDGCRLALASIALSAGNCEPSSGASGFSEPQSSRFVRDASTFLCDDADLPRELNLSTAALLSARFPYVSPAGGMTSCSEHGKKAGFRPRTFALDGGILDNSGAGAVEQVWRDIETKVQMVNESKTGPCVIPRLLVLDNAYAESATAKAKSRPVQGIAPLQAGLGFYGSRSDRELASAQDVIVQAATRAVTLCKGAGKSISAIGESVAIIHPRVSPGTQAPLGWTLSSSSVESMRFQLISRENLIQISRVRCWFVSGVNC